VRIFIGRWRRINLKGRWEKTRLPKDWPLPTPAYQFEPARNLDLRICRPQSGRKSTTSPIRLRGSIAPIAVAPERTSSGPRAKPDVILYLCDPGKLEAAPKAAISRQAPRRRLPAKAIEFLQASGMGRRARRRRDHSPSHAWKCRSSKNPRCMCSTGIRASCNSPRSSGNSRPEQSAIFSRSGRPGL